MMRPDQRQLLIDLIELHNMAGETVIGLVEVWATCPCIMRYPIEVSLIFAAYGYERAENMDAYHRVLEQCTPSE